MDLNPYEPPLTDAPVPPNRWHRWWFLLARGIADVAIIALAICVLDLVAKKPLGWPGNAYIGVFTVIAYWLLRAIRRLIKRAA